MSLQEQVTSTAAWLDVRYPGWHDQIDTEWLDISHPESCIGGQLLGDKWGWSTLDQEHRKDLGVSTGDALYGSTPTPLWLEEIAKRRVPSVVPVEACV